MACKWLVRCCIAVYSLQFTNYKKTDAARKTTLSLFVLILKTLTGKPIEIDIEPTDTVNRIKERVEEKEGIPPAQQRLIFSGKNM